MATKFDKGFIDKSHYHTKQANQIHDVNSTVILLNPYQASLPFNNLSQQILHYDNKSPIMSIFSARSFFIISGSTEAAHNSPMKMMLMSRAN